MPVKLETIRNIIEYNMNQKSCIVYFSYIDESLYPVTKAMLKPCGNEDLKVFYLSTNTSSNKINCLLKNNKASLYFVDKRFFRGISLIGNAEVLTDDKTKARFFKDGDEKYYHEGPTDPDYCIIKFNTERIRCYNNFSSTDYDLK